jgi:hypothetical protein
METVGERVIDDLNLRVVDDSPVVIENPFDAVLGGIRLCSGAISCGESNKPVPRVGGGSEKSVGGYARSAENSDA